MAKRAQVVGLAVAILVVGLLGGLAQRGGPDASCGTSFGAEGCRAPPGSTGGIYERPDLSDSAALLQVNVGEHDGRGSLPDTEAERQKAGDVALVGDDADSERGLLTKRLDGTDSFPYTECVVAKFKNKRRCISVSTQDKTHESKTQSHLLTSNAKECAKLCDNGVSTVESGSVFYFSLKHTGKCRCCTSGSDSNLASKTGWMTWRCTATPVDCAMKEWSDWTGCSTTCGSGTRSRDRSVVTEPKHGGKACDASQDEVACEGPSCPFLKCGKVTYGSTCQEPSGRERWTDTCEGPEGVKVRMVTDAGTEAERMISGAGIFCFEFLEPAKATLMLTRRGWVSITSDPLVITRESPEASLGDFVMSREPSFDWNTSIVLTFPSQVNQLRPMIEISMPDPHRSCYVSMSGFEGGKQVSYSTPFYCGGIAMMDMVQADYHITTNNKVTIFLNPKDVLEIVNHDQGDYSMFFSVYGGEGVLESDASVKVLHADEPVAEFHIGDPDVQIKNNVVWDVFALDVSNGKIIACSGKLNIICHDVRKFNGANVPSHGGPR